MRQLSTRIFISFLVLFLLFGTVNTALAQQTSGSKTFDIKHSQKSSASWKFAVRAGGLYSLKSLEKFSYKVEGGAGYNVDILYAIGNNQALRLSVGKSGINLVNKDIRTIMPAVKPATPPLPAHMYIINQRDGLDVSHVFLSAQFNSILKGVGKNNSMVYGFLGPGVLLNNVTQEYDFYNDSTLTSKHYSYQTDDNRFAFQFGLGAMYLLFKSFGVDASALAIVTSGNEDYISLRAPNYSPIYDLRLGLIAIF